MFIPAGFLNEKVPKFENLTWKNIVWKVTGFFSSRASRILDSKKKTVEWTGDFVRKIGKWIALWATLAWATVGAFPENKPKDNTEFIQAPNKKRSNKFEEIPVKRIKKKDESRTIDISKIKQTTGRIRKTEVWIPYNADCFDESWKFTESLKKWTKILIDSESSIFSQFNTKTGKYEAYVKVKWTIHVDKFGTESIDPRSWYIQAPWLNSTVQKKSTTPWETVKSQTKQTTKEEAPKSPNYWKVNFSWYLGPDGREIPAYIMKAVTVNYFWKIISPKLEATIANVDNDIMVNRQEIIKEAVIKKVSAKKTKKYKEQVEKLEKKKWLTEINQAIQTLMWSRDDTVFYDPTITKIVKWVQNTPEWQKIVQQAAVVHNKKRRNIS
jgi:hypothetical protein